MIRPRRVIQDIDDRREFPRRLSDVDLENLMGATTIDSWKPVFDDLVLELEETTAPEKSEGTWYVALAKFSRHSFARLLLGEQSAGLAIRLEIALGPPASDPESLANQLTKLLASRSKTDWECAAEDTPWVLETTLVGEDDEARTRLRRVVTEILKLSDRFEQYDQPRQWRQLLAEATERDADPDTDDDEESTSSPFESIGADEPTAEAAESAVVDAAAVTRVNDQLHLALGFGQVLTPNQISALTEGLEHHLHTKFDVQVRTIDPDDRPELRMPSSARTKVYFSVHPGKESDALTTLRKEVETFLDRLQKFSSYGVDLFEYLGVADTVLDSGAQPMGREDTRGEQTLSFRTTAPDRRDRGPNDEESQESEGAVVLDLSGSAGTGDHLEAKNYTDSRLHRDDADTALVDLVLRHPGYSDRRIGQVLSILFSIDYHDAVKIADSAPCVIAWGVSQKRAQTFKEVIEQAGGKVLLVEPGTFGEG